MTLDFDGRVALITGAGQGLGRAHALLLAARGADVCVADLVGAEEAVAEIEAAGGSAIALSGDVADSAAGEALVAAAIARFGRLDIVVNNAGIVRDSSFAKLTDENLDAVLAVHLRGAFNVARPAWRQMREQGYGRILNTTSNSGLLGNFGQSNYAAAKMGLVGLTRVLAIEGRKNGIQVNALAPMGKTPMTDGIQWDVFERFDPALVAPVAAWLVHEDCPTTGEIYSAAGGHVARFFVGLTPGYTKSDLSPEDVRDNFEQIRDTDGFEIFGEAGEEIARLAEELSAS
jgi:NAD(P)-dependent dehydrogenase (short-subunit alcohol dehydrogenase family)